jgi:streptomycin 6-kinase
MTSAADIPAPFRQTIAEVHGAGGVAWLQALPALIDETAERWSLHVQPPFALSYNYVAPAVGADGTPVVLKLGVPNPLLTREIVALGLYGGQGAARVLEADSERGCLLIERLLPGTMLAELEDDEAATAIAAEVMRQLWRPLPAGHPFPSVAEWAGGLRRLRMMFDGATGPLPPKLVEMAEDLFEDLIASSGEPVLIHADLHHYNILAAERAPWVALDPHGVAGERAYEVGALLRNPFPTLPPMGELRRIQARRVEQLAELLGFDGKRIAAWGMAQAVLSAWWSIEDHGAGWEPAIQYAEALAALL